MPIAPECRKVPVPACQVPVVGAGRQWHAERLRPSSGVSPLAAFETRQPRRAIAFALRREASVQLALLPESRSVGVSPLVNPLDPPELGTGLAVAHELVRREPQEAFSDMAECVRPCVAHLIPQRKLLRDRTGRAGGSPRRPRRVRAQSATPPSPDISSTRHASRVATRRPVLARISRGTCGRVPIRRRRSSDYNPPLRSVHLRALRHPGTPCTPAPRHPWRSWHRWHPRHPGTPGTLGTSGIPVPGPSAPGRADMIPGCAIDLLADGVGRF